MSQTASFPPRRRGWRRAALAAVVVLPLAFAGLVVAAVSQADDGLDRIPAAIVNNDEMVTTTLADGTEQQTLAGRLLVTELTGEDSPGFDWTITNTEDAEQMLADGEVYAILEVPETFSSSILSLSSTDPQQADISITTDDSHDYLTGSVAQLAGEALVATFGEPITEQYISGLYSSIGSLGDALSSAADGATQLTDGATLLADGTTQSAAGASSLATGAGSLATGLSTISTGTASSATGASSLATGISQYTSGASTLSTGVTDYVAGVSQLATGLDTFETQAAGLDATDVGVSQYVAGVNQVATGLDALIASVGVVAPVDPSDPGYPAYAAYLGLQQVSAGLNEVSANGDLVVGGVNTAFTQLAAGAAASSAGADQLVAAGSQLASGASTLAASGAQLNSGASSLASGLALLASGTSASTTGAGVLASGAGELATGSETIAAGTSVLATGVGDLAVGLSDGAAQVPTMTDEQATSAADVATSPIALTVERDNEVSDIGQIMATFFVPLGLWIGALAVFLVMRPVTRSVLASTAANGRIALSVVARACAVTAAQALLLVLLLHVSLDVSWSLLPATLLFALLISVAFTAFHYFLTVAFGRVGMVVSLLLLALQITATGSIYPIELIAPVFQSISPFLPLTYAVNGMQAIISDGGLSTLLLAALALVAFGLLSLGAALIALQRIRRARFISLVRATV